MNWLPAMSQTLEKRVEELEKKVAELSARLIRSNVTKDWRRTFGIFQNDQDFEEATRLGREYREQQTYEFEVLWENPGHHALRPQRSLISFARAPRTALMMRSGSGLSGA